MRARHIALLAIAPLVGGGCTLLIGLDPDSEAPPCEADADCVTGSRCAGGVCVEAGGTPVVPAACTGLADSDWTVSGPAGATLRVDEGALPGSICLSSELGSDTVVVPGHTTLGPSVRFGPEDEALDGAATVRFEAESGACASGCTVFRLEDDAWRPLPVPDTDGGVTVGDEPAARTPELGVFVAAAAPSGEGPTDAGAPDEDAGGGVDAGPVDAGGGEPDAGSGDLFAGCDLSATSCGGGLACVPDPFDASAGVCLATCDVGGAACASCGGVSTLAGEWCRPPALSGAGAPGASCSADADCSAASTAGCVDFGDGAAVCAVACDPEVPAACGAGCCARGARVGGAEAAYCRVESACVSPDGAPCLTADECAGGTCAVAPDGAARCTSVCDTSGGCGAGLCCLPTGCDGAGTCVAAETCAGATELVCGAICLDDAACTGADELCHDGACTTLPTCECFAHGQCGATELCEIDGAQQTACTSNGDDPCCGSCTALAATGDCYSDANCPPAGDATAVLCELPSACADDPFGQCLGSCRALAAGECVTASDCGGGEVCIDHTCR